MTEAEQLLEATDSVLVIDWPTREVPETLARAGFGVVVKGGPEPDNYTAHAVREGQVVARRLGHAPDHVDLVFAYRPVSEVPAIVVLAKEVGASGVWFQSGRASNGDDDPKGCWMPEGESQTAREIVEAAGLAYVDDTYIADAVRQFGIQK